jgi:CDP-diacylglycerol--serine O-phosphatidyltransferase
MREELKKGVYIIPSLFTCGNMTFGLLSILKSIEGDFIKASWFLVFALVCDILDGRIARMTNTTSYFGSQLDSFSDLVSFCVAPALLMYMLVLNTMGKLGVGIAVLFVLCGALRLARFNMLARKGVVYDTFIGLPTPASAGVIISFVLSYKLIGPEGYALNFRTIPVLMKMLPVFFKAMPLVTVALSFLMVSNVPYFSFKNIHFSKPYAIQLLVALIVLALLIFVFPQNVFFIIFSVYVLSGLLMYLPNKLWKKLHREEKEESEGE